ncbi:MAG: hypothetical protein ACRDN0_11465, partial [Trebonia sp.]
MSTISPKYCQAPKAITAIIASVGLDRVTWGSPAPSSRRLNRPVPGWKNVYQMNAVATGGTTSGITKNARTCASPGSLTSSSSAMAKPSSIVTATNPTVNT